MIGCILAIPISIFAIYTLVPVCGALISFGTTALIIFFIIKQQQKANSLGSVNPQ